MSVYLKRFVLPDEMTEHAFFSANRPNCYKHFYPFGLFKGRFPELTFAPVTIFCGGNGSGKTTVLNLIAERLRISRSTPFNRTEFFGKFASCCNCTLGDDEDGEVYDIPRGSRYIASDDVFQTLFRLRKEADSTAKERSRVIDTYFENRNRSAEFKNTDLLEDYDKFKEYTDSRLKNCSAYVRERVEGGKRQRSNGESAFVHFTEMVGEEALYLLDEPENSLSPALQLELLDFLMQSVRLDNQFIIATHSPLLLSFPGARIYDFDAKPPAVTPWEQLPNVRIYARFFKHHASRFDVQPPE